MSEEESEESIPGVPSTYRGTTGGSSKPTDGGPEATDGSEHSVELAGLAAQDGWYVEGSAARVHYSGATDRYSIEYYDPSECVLYWKVPPEGAGETAVPVGRDTVPSPLRERIREDLATAGIDPAIEDQHL